MSEPAVRIRDLSVSYGDLSVLDGVSVDVEAGQFVGLIGANGAGKTTLLRTVNGVLDPDAGTVAVDGDDVSGLSSKAVSRRVATVPQDTSLSFDFDVRDVVAMGRNPYRRRLVRDADPNGDEAVDRALERTETARFADRSIQELSGGQRQRVVLARALAQETPVLVLDEPTASLDVNHQVRTLELVADLVAEGKTVIAAVHDLNFAAHYCDELLLLADGDVVATGPPPAVLTEDNLEGAFDTRAVVTSHPITGSTYVSALPERDANRDARVHVVAGGATGSRLLYLLDAAGFSVSTGALNRGDSDLETARTLGLDVVEMLPGQPVDDAAEAAVRSRVEAADVTVVADVEVGEGNRPNLAAATAADQLVVVEERPFSRRNYDGDRARALYERLRERGRVVDPGDVLGAVEAATEAETASQGSETRNAEPIPPEQSE